LTAPRKVEPLTEDAVKRLATFRHVTAKDDSRISRYSVEPATYGDVRSLLDAYDAARARITALEAERDVARTEGNSLAIDADELLAEVEAWRAMDDAGNGNTNFMDMIPYTRKARRLRAQNEGGQRG
jgi:hypothetical protein